MLNVEKLFDEAGKYVTAWRNPPAAQHDDAGTVWTNKFSEATKASYYFPAHVDQFVWPLFIIETIALIFVVVLR